MVLLAFIALPLFGWLFIPRLETVVTERDFESQKDCRKFVELHVPLPLPELAVVSKIEYVSWLDWTLDAQIDLPTKSGLAYILKLQSLDGNSDANASQFANTNTTQYTMTGEFPKQGIAIYDTNSEVLTIKCSNLENN